MVIPADKCRWFPLSWDLLKPQLVLLNAVLKQVRGKVRLTRSVSDDNTLFAVRCSTPSVLINQAMCCCLMTRKVNIGIN